MSNYLNIIELMAKTVLCAIVVFICVLILLEHTNEHFTNSQVEAQWISYSCELKDKAIIDDIIIRCLKNTTVGEVDCHGKVAYIFGCKQTSNTNEKVAGLIIWPIGIK